MEWAWVRIRTGQASRREAILSVFLFMLETSFPSQALVRINKDDMSAMDGWVYIG